jgi:hypothetical protein
MYVASSLNHLPEPQWESLGLDYNIPLHGSFGEKIFL